MQPDNPLWLYLCVGSLLLGLVVGYVVEQSGGTFEQSGPVFNQASYGVALPKGTTMTQAVQAAIKSLIANGTYGAIMKKWGTGADAVNISGVTINGAGS